jgi:hypothetical protein
MLGFKSKQQEPTILSPRDIGYRWLQDYGYRNWVIRFRDLHYPDLRRENGCGCGEHILGLCDYKNMTIWIQRGMKNTDALETIQHELAHVFCPGEGHGPIWHDWFLYIIRTQLPESWWKRKQPIQEQVQVQQDDGLALGFLLGWFWGR